jgi:hypothetical protein
MCDEVGKGEGKLIAFACRAAGLVVDVTAPALQTLAQTGTDLVGVVGLESRKEGEGCVDRFCLSSCRPGCP